MTGEHWAPAGLAETLGRLADTAGVTGRCNPHAFRHGLARAWLLNGGDLASLSEFLGHANIQTTADFYGRLTNAEVHEKHRALSPVRSLVEAHNGNGQAPVVRVEPVGVAVAVAPVRAAVAAPPPVPPVPPVVPVPVAAASETAGLVGNFSWTAATTTGALWR